LIENLNSQTHAEQLRLEEEVQENLRWVEEASDSELDLIVPEAQHADSEENRQAIIAAWLKDYRKELEEELQRKLAELADQVDQSIDYWDLAANINHQPQLARWLLEQLRSRHAFGTIRKRAVGHALNVAIVKRRAA